MEVSLVMDYLSFAFILFFITFFADVFYFYFRYRYVIPRKMLSWKRGGLFEHYKLVGFIVLVVALIHGMTGLDPFAGSALHPFAAEREPNILSLIVLIVITYIPIAILLIFTFIFLLYFAHSLYAKARKVENRKEYLGVRGHRIVVLATIIGITLTSALYIYIVYLSAP